MIDYTEMSKTLENASLFELWRMSCLIREMLEDPDRAAAAKRALKPGMDISYFDRKENRLIEATIIEISRAYVFVQNKHDNARWNLPVYWLNLENVDTDITPPVTGTISKANLKVGDNVGFFSRRDNKELFGRVIKLNPKNAKIEVADYNGAWTVPYRMLFFLIDSSGSSSSSLLLEGEIV